ncbi:MAG: acyl-CoA dehydrogenase family protein [Candidatus Binatia bacterium]|jgi:glutaryl-CoA dehydrogenase (non-decarboxylating)|nr:acyl-CoA dehydrogenase family protein [Candidatus Binatia bacterium]
MDFELSEELIAVRDLARDFAQKEIAPTTVKDDQEHLFRKELVVRMGELGFFGCLFPEEYGGTDLGYLALSLISEEIAHVHSAVRVHLNVQIGPALALLRFGTEDQKKKWIPPLIRGEIIGCFAITEPNAGSDVASMATTATKSENGYILNGTKTWISNGPIADAGVFYAYTDKSQRHHGISAFFVDLIQNNVTRRSLDKTGTLASPTGELTFDNVSVPAERRIGQEGEGFKICMWQLNQTRLNCAAGALGAARAAREAAVSYANQREQFGQKIGQFQMIQDTIAQMVVEEEAARLLVYRAAFLADQKKSNNLEVSMAKYAAAEAAAHAADSAFKILGAYAYSTEFPVERYLRDAKSYQIVEGSSNIQKLIIAQDALGYRKATR